MQPITGDYFDGVSSTRNSVVINVVEDMVDIGGAVKRPGVYPVVAGQRVYELVDKAGGLTEEADLTFFDKNINLRFKEKCYVDKVSFHVYKVSSRTFFLECLEIVKACS